MKLIDKVISGGQTGVDQAALVAAKRCGIPTGGTAPLGFMTEEGPRRSVLLGFGLVECGSSEYPARTLCNVRDSDATLLIAPARMGRGSSLTYDMCIRERKHVRRFRCEYLFMRVSSMQPDVRLLIEWLYEQAERCGRPLVLNIAGPRESTRIGVTDECEAFLRDLFRDISRRWK